MSLASPPAVVAPTLVVSATASPAPAQITWWNAAGPPPSPPPHAAVKPVPPDRRFVSVRGSSSRHPKPRSAVRRGVPLQQQKRPQGLALVSSPETHEEHNGGRGQTHNNDDHTNTGAGTGAIDSPELADPKRPPAQPPRSPPPSPPPSPPSHAFPADSSIYPSYQQERNPSPTNKKDSYKFAPSDLFPPKQQQIETKIVTSEGTTAAAAKPSPAPEHQPIPTTADSPHHGLPAQSTPAVDPTPTYPSYTQAIILATTTRAQVTLPPQENTASAPASIPSDVSRQIFGTASATLPPASSASTGNPLETPSQGSYNSAAILRPPRSSMGIFGQPEPTSIPVDRESDILIKVTNTLSADRPLETDPTISVSAEDLRDVLIGINMIFSPAGHIQRKIPPDGTGKSTSWQRVKQNSFPSDPPPAVEPSPAGPSPDFGRPRPVPTSESVPNNQASQGSVNTEPGKAPVSVEADRQGGGNIRPAPTNGIPVVRPPSTATGLAIPGLKIRPQVQPAVVPVIVDTLPQPTKRPAPTAGAPEIASQPGTPITGHQKVVSGEVDGGAIASNNGDNVGQDSQDADGRGSAGTVPIVGSSSGGTPNRPASQPGVPAAPGVAGTIGDADSKQTGGHTLLSASATGGLVGAALVFLVAIGVVTVAARRRRRRRHVHARGKRAYAPFDVSDDLRPMVAAKSSDLASLRTIDEAAEYYPSVYMPAQLPSSEPLDAFSPDYKPYHHQQELMCGYFASSLSINTAPLVPLPSNNMAMPALMLIPPTPLHDASDTQSDESPFSDRHASSSDMHETISTDGAPSSDRRASTKTASTTDSAMPLRVYSSLLRSGNSSSSMASDVAAVAAAAAAGGGGGGGGGSTNGRDGSLKPPPSSHRRLAHRLSSTSTSSMYSTLSNALRALQWRRTHSTLQRTQRRRRRLLISSASLSSMSSTSTSTTSTCSSVSGGSFSTTTGTSGDYYDSYASSGENTTAWGGSEAGTDSSSCREFIIVTAGAGADAGIFDDSASNVQLWHDDDVDPDDVGGIDEIVIIPALRPLPLPTRSTRPS
ncbi:hypothetical protein HDU86_005214 [Geranomyces michiganensis]|nr:hypothetical protein HDU86_005214 [Geranomyces michiganensis]